MKETTLCANSLSVLSAGCFNLCRNISCSKTVDKFNHICCSSFRNEPNLDFIPEVILRDKILKVCENVALSRSFDMNAVFA